ncbi:MAG: PqqD family protein [Streptococcaceae bacterium]|nr:PqqD family protein [Streptococcaceae bacterium]
MYYQLSNNLVIKRRKTVNFGLNMVNGTTYQMNDTMFDIVSFLGRDKRTKEQLLEYLLKEYDVAIEEIKEEVEDILDNLVSQEIIVVS